MFFRKHSANSAPVGPGTPFVDIHSHLLPGIDDGAKSVEESLAMARLAVSEGTRTMIVTPHQLGAFRCNTGELIRARTSQLQQLLAEHDVPLDILPGADVRIEPDMLPRLQSGDVLTVGDRGRHVLLELPHELYFPLEPVLDQLRGAGYVGILTHPERNQGLLRNPEVIAPLVDAGCLMQVTAGSVVETFGEASREMSEWMLSEGFVHFLATDAHGIRSRRPLMRRAFQRVAELAGAETAELLCCEHPSAVAAGRDVAPGPVRTREGRSRRRAAA